MSKRTEHQKGEERWILRSVIKEAEYNPRVIGEGAEKRLKSRIKKHGLIGPLVWNERTGNLVSGHQRLKQLDKLERYPKGQDDYELRVTVIDVPLKEEMVLNVQFNNPSMQGEWDIDLLGSMALEGGEFFLDEAGFTDSDKSMLFGGIPEFEAMFEDTEEVKEAKENISAVREARADREATREALTDAQDDRFWFKVFCQDRKAKENLLRALGLPVNESTINGALIARKLGVELDA